MNKAEVSMYIRKGVILSDERSFGQLNSSFYLHRPFLNTIHSILN